jgi:hypothetical protein
VDESAARDADRSDAIPGLRQEEVHDCPWAKDRDFLSAKAATERPLSPMRRNAREPHWVQKPQDASEKAG